MLQLDEQRASCGEPPDDRFLGGSPSVSSQTAVVYRYSFSFSTLVVSLHVSGWSGCRLQLWHWTARSSVALCAPISVALAVRRTVKGVYFQREAGKERVE